MGPFEPELCARPKRRASLAYSRTERYPMAEFLVERYVSDASVAENGAEQARITATRMTRNGMPIRLVRSIFLPEDETSLLLFEAASAEIVRETARNAGLSIDRIAEAIPERR